MMYVMPMCDISFGLVHDSNKEILDFQQLFGHLVVFSHVDLLLSCQLLHYHLHLALQLHHFLNLLLFHRHVAAHCIKRSLRSFRISCFPYSSVP